MISTEWIPVVSAVVGGATGVVGTLTTQAFTLKRDKELRASEVEKERLANDRGVQAAKEQALSEARTKQLAEALQLHQGAVAWLGIFHAERRQHPREVSADLLMSAVQVMSKCAEVVALGENNLSQTARNIYSYFSTALSLEGGKPRGSYLVDGETTQLEAEVHSLVARMQPPRLEPWASDEGAATPIPNH
jgi:hypothetical protein